MTVYRPAGNKKFKTPATPSSGQKKTRAGAGKKHFFFCPQPAAYKLRFKLKKKKREKQYLCYKKYGVHQGLSPWYTNTISALHVKDEYNINTDS